MMPNTVSLRGEYGQNSFFTAFNRASIHRELKHVVNQKFDSIDLNNRVSLGEAWKCVGLGAYSDVYEGTLDQTKVAVKVLRCHDKSTVPAFKKVLNEVYVWSKLEHENIIKLLGITTSFNQTVSIVLPLMSRGNVFDYVQNPRVDPRPLILGIANGLNYLHTHDRGPIIHGDIKGSNVLVSDDGRALLTDFGFSHLAGASLSLAAEQHAGGTLRWMAPEYLEDECIMTPAGDVWAFGMTILELFTRKRPFHHLQHDGAIVLRIMRIEIQRPILDTFPHLTDEWWNICLSCWNRDSSQRPMMSNIASDVKVLQPLFLANMITKHALRYSINLDGFVSKANAIPLLRGGFSTVWLGTLQLQEAKTVVNALENNGFLGVGKTGKVAIKIFHRNFPRDEEIIKKFLEEVHTWSKLDHPNVLPLIGITTDFEWTVSIVSPWMEKGTARDFVHNKSIDPRPLIQGIASGLCYMHNLAPNPVYHGDVKGCNVLISANGQAFLTNFGLSLLTNPSFSWFITPKGGDMFRWMAPEMLDDDSTKPSAAGDVWSFAMTVLELFTREIPFHHVRGSGNIVAKLLQGPPDRPSAESTCFRLTDEWWSMCGECWNTVPSLRPSMVDVTNKIETFLVACH